MTPERLKEIRVRLFHMTQQEFATLLRLTRVTIACWETGSRPIPPSMGLLIELVAQDKRDKLSQRRWYLRRKATQMSQAASNNVSGEEEPIYYE